MEPEVVQLPLWQQAWGWFEANKRQTFLGAGGLAVVALIIALFLYHQNETDIAASEALSNVAAPPVAGAARGDTADAYLKVAAAYPNSRAGARALLLAGGSLFVEGKYPEAKTQFERFIREHRDSHFIGEALLGVAATLDAQGNSSGAITAYKELIDRHSADPVLPQARFALARLYEAQNQPEQARKLFEEVERSNPYGSLGSEAGMRLEELKIKYPSLATPVAPAVTPAASAVTPAATAVMPAATAKTNATPLQPKKR